MSKVKSISCAKPSELGDRMLTLCESLMIARGIVGNACDPSTIVMIIPILHMGMSGTIVIGTGNRRVVPVNIGDSSSASLDRKTGVRDGNSFRVLMLRMMLLGVDLLVLLEVLWALECLVTYLTNVWL